MRAVFFIMKALATSLLTLLTLAVALWWWSSTPSALPWVLTQLPHFLPSGQSLQIKDVSGKLLNGGHIGSLRWTQGALSIQAQDIRISWNLRPLLDKHLQLGELHIATLHIDDQRPASTTGNALTPPISLSLPLTLELPFHVSRLRHTGRFELEASELSGNYTFDSFSHRLDKGYAQISSGTYQLSGSLQAQTPMALQLQLSGQVRTSVPGRKAPLMVSALATLTGDIAASNTVLKLQAHLKPEPVPGAMQASLSAQIKPWQAQPLSQAQAQWQSLNLAALWPQAPQTQLSGQANVTPIDTKALDANHINFTLQLANTQPAPQQFKLRLQGQWAAPQLTLSDVNLTTPQAQILGEGSYHTRTYASKAKVALSLPGLSASMDGHLDSRNGQGTLALEVQDAQRATQWLARWPLLASLLQGQQAQGRASLQAHWQGGWQQQGQRLHINAHLQAPQLTWPVDSGRAKDSASALQLRELQADVSGNLAALTLRTQGKAQLGARQLHWQAQAQGGQRAGQHWQGQFSQLTLRAQDDTHPGFWTLTPQPFSVNWQQTSSAHTLQLGASSAQLSSPLPGLTQLSWQPMRWTQARRPAGAAAQPPAQWQSQGRISQLPFAWLDALSPKTLDALGLSSTLVLSGSWDASHTDALHLSAMLERSAGDLRLSLDVSPSRSLPALLQEARLQLNLADDQLSASLRWRSERVGHALLAFSTQLQTSAQGWRWPDTAPLGGSLQIELPPVQAWSMLAPPGWRLRGTLQANANLTGTRQQPQWQGTLQANDLAVRSVADGIDFQQGSLRARLEGQQLFIDDFTLHGGAGGAGGQLKITGLAQWLSSSQPNMVLAQQLQIALDAQAQTLRLSSRSDRLLTVSGQLHAQLDNSTLSLSGQLDVDQALITLPSETAPQLSSDVVLPSFTAVKPTEATRQAQRTAPRFTPEVQLTLNLGNNFKVRGRGLTTRLAGQLELQASGNASPSLMGEVSTVRGTYQAYGQRLDIEQGVLRFVGPSDNPGLNILALRPKLSQRVGVQVLGTVQSPVVRLYADPDLPDAEKLSWLVLGRASSGSGGEAALLQQAAWSLLGSNGQSPSASLTQALGLDELQFNNSDTDNGASVTLGKRLGRDFYVAYESGLAGIMGVFTIFYDLSKSLSLRAQTGQQSAVDLIWTHRYD